MAGYKTMALIKPDGIRAFLVGGELEHFYPFAFRAVYGPEDDFFTNFLSPFVFSHPHGLDHGSTTALIVEVLYKCHLESADDFFCFYHHHQFLIGILIYDLKSLIIGQW